MFSADLTLARTLMDLRIEEALHRAERRRLLQQAGFRQRAWLSRHGCWLLGQLGDALIALGRRLQRYRIAQSLSLESTQALHNE